MPVETPEIKLIRAIIQNAFTDALAKPGRDNKSQIMMAKDFLLNEKDSSLPVYLGFLGIEECNFRKHAKIILESTIDNFCDEDKKNHGIELYIGHLTTKQKKRSIDFKRSAALKLMFNNYISFYIKWILSNGE